MKNAFKKLFVPTLLAASAIAVTSAQATEFNLIDTGGTAVGTQARRGFDIAAAYWSSVLTNSNVTINLNIGFQTLGTGILGQTGSTSSVNFNSQVYNALGTHITSTLDTAAVASLRPLTNSATYGANVLTMTTNALNAAGNGYVDTATRIDNNASVNNVAVVVNTAVDKALGITTNANGVAINYALADGSITFSNTFKFDFDPSNGIDADAFDFIGVAIHEIGHALGFVSGVDSYDFYTAPGSASTTPGGLEGFVVGSVLDLYRYSAAGRLDWSTQNTPYFSIDGGATQVFGSSLFSTGTRNGDGQQASHWKDSARGAPQLGILDPTSGYGQMQEVTALDLAAYDAIGWRIAFDPLLNPTYRQSTANIYAQFAGTGAVPEPATWAMMLLGFGMIGFAARRRSHVKTTVSFA